MKQFCWMLFFSGVAAQIAFGGTINSQADVAAGSAGVGACAGSQAFGGGLVPGNIYCAGIDTTPDGPYVHHTSASAAFNQPAAFASVTNPTTQPDSNVYADSAWAMASQATLHLFSTFNETGSTAFVGAVADAGWNDTVTITGGTGQGIWNAQVFVHGDLSAPGGYASQARLVVAPYVNGGQIAIGQTSGPNIDPKTVAFFAANNSYCKTLPGFSANCAQYGTPVISSIGNQEVIFTASNANFNNQDPNPPDTIQNLAFSQMITFEIPFTYGVSFKLGIWADSSAGVYSSGAFPTAGTADVGQTILWGGSSVTGNPNAQATGLDGFNYNVSNAVAPEPSYFVVAGVALGLGAVLRRRAISR